VARWRRLWQVNLLSTRRVLWPRPRLGCSNMDNAVAGWAWQGFSQKTLVRLKRLSAVRALNSYVAHRCTPSTPLTALRLSCISVHSPIRPILCAKDTSSVKRDANAHSFLDHLMHLELDITLGPDLFSMTMCAKGLDSRTHYRTLSQYRSIVAADSPERGKCTAIAWKGPTRRAS
jgi:hypothetical protein